MRLWSANIRLMRETLHTRTFLNLASIGHVGIPWAVFATEWRYRTVALPDKCLQALTASLGALTGLRPFTPSSMNCTKASTSRDRLCISWSYLDRDPNCKALAWSHCLDSPDLHILAQFCNTVRESALHLHKWLNTVQLNSKLTTWHQLEWQE